jgi:hypothetical protein
MPWLLKTGKPYNQVLVYPLAHPRIICVKGLLVLVLMLSVPLAWAEPASAPAPAAGATKPADDKSVPPVVDDSVLREENARLRLEVDRLRSEAVNAPLIDRENQQLRERIISMESERERLIHENQTLGGWRDGLKTGAGIFVIGLVIGLLLGRARRRSGWSEV